MKVGVYEHLTASKNIYSPIWVEGEAMLKASIEDLSSAGYEVYALDSIPPKKPVDLVVVIAPSSSRTIYSLIKACEDEGLDVLNSPSSAVFLASDKALLLRNLQLNGIKTPWTVVSSFDDGLDIIERALQMHRKVVVKPADGDGCMGLSIVASPHEVSAALKKVKQSTRLPYFLVQEFIDGVNVSVNLLSAGDHVVPLSVNLQEVSLRGPFENSSYIKGLVPYREKNELLTSTALRVVRCLGWTRGFFGVDMVLKGEEAYAVEVNPRLTTSYLALREISSLNILDMLIRACFNEASLEQPQLIGTAVVKKMVADNDMIVKPFSLKVPGGAKLLSTIIDKRPTVRKGEAYAIYVMKVRDVDDAINL
ncbi:MAG: ATP-grasp domain-containing protein [Candidatus Nezhaarchaeota archaeon]|nr:ATP-grasp domain-containing protein [Candidatus Nezhaarchaeota archaeon]MCX8141273.1 ATP-grasp domain-containing protein [Candidatus Nezhaarchaeota archaeon]MDW8049539.1 ATP-grasp domain-containing protein [Nitrososphaerota archaeon]